MALLSNFEFDSYHRQMLDKLRSVGAPKVSKNAQQTIDGLAQPTAPKKPSKLDSIVTPDANAVAAMFKPKVAPLIMPTGGITPRDQPTSQPVYSPANGAGNPPGAGGSLDAFLAKVAQKESGGNYSARNKDSGALGKYQVMPANVASWTKQALGKSLTPQQFLNSPEAQEAVAKKILGGYVAKYGEQGAAIAWYSGESNAKKFAQTGQVSTKSQGKYPSIAAYAASLTKR